MKATLKFNLPEDADEHYVAINGAAAFAVINEIESELRRLCKYENKDVINGMIDIEKIRKTISEIITDANIRKDGIL